MRSCRRVGEDDADADLVAEAHRQQDGYVNDQPDDDEDDRADQSAAFRRVDASGVSTVVSTTAATACSPPWEVPLGLGGEDGLRERSSI